MTTMWVENFTVLFIAVVVSMVVAFVIRGLVNVLGRERAPRTPVDLAPAPAPAPVSAGQSGPPPEHVAAIAAAVAETMDDAVVVHIEPARFGVGWASSGRAQHHGSHNLGRSR